ncbi:MAG: hypothetical protein U0350_28260 [Caldilineaceae bacterium]
MHRPQVVGLTTNLWPVQRTQVVPDWGCSQKGFAPVGRMARTQMR